MQFRIDLDRAPQRLLRVSLTVDLGPGEESRAVELFLPVWTPGSYLVREFARHLGGVRVVDADRGVALPWRKSAKNRYAVTVGRTTRMRVDYEVYAHELSVRTAHVTDRGAVWNGACVLLWPVGREQEAATIDVVVPAGWRLVTGKGDPELLADGLCRYRCDGLDEAVDTPCIAGPIEEFAFDVRGRRHRLCAVGLEGVRPPETFAADLQRTVETVATLFPGELPFDEYVFLGVFAESSRGGLEHARSSLLLAPRTTFHPRTDYEDFLSLVAHEYLHVWNVKRMRPTDLWSFDYERENHTELLWVAEGFTAYYDDLSVRRAGISSPRRYLDILGGHVRGMLAMPGRFAQSLVEASYDAWIRFYRPDENTRNSTQNYYANGALAALVIDAAIRESTGGARSLDHALRALFDATWSEGRGYTHEDVLAALREAAGRDLDELVNGLVRGPFDPDLDRALGLYGLRLERGGGRPWIGIQLENGTTKVATVERDGPAWHAGICPGDELLGVAGLRVSSSRWSDIWHVAARSGERLELLLARQGRIRAIGVEPADRPGDPKIVSESQPTESQLAHREAWCGARDLRD